MASVKALIFGSIGTVTETSELQREAFNAAFAEHALDWNWNASDYRAMISGNRETVGGTSRIIAYARHRGEDLSEVKAAAVHATKTRLFQDIMVSRKLPLNPGVDALLCEARASGVTTVFASTTARQSIEAMLRATEPSLEGRFDLVMSGDDVTRPKPDREIYLTVLDRLHVEANEVVAIEDSQPSLDAACHAGIATFAVPGLLWRETVFVGAAGVFESLAGVTLAMLAQPLRPAVAASAASLVAG